MTECKIFQIVPNKPINFIELNEKLEKEEIVLKTDHPTHEIFISHNSRLPSPLQQILEKLNNSFLTLVMLKKQNLINSSFFQQTTESNSNPNISLFGVFNFYFYLYYFFIFFSIFFLFLIFFLLIFIFII